MNSVEDLDVFKLAHQLTIKIYAVTKTLPKEETYTRGRVTSTNHDHVPLFSFANARFRLTMSKIQDPGDFNDLFPEYRRISTQM